MRIRIRKKYLFYILAFSSAIIAALAAGIDAITQVYIADPWALGVACFIFGVIISLIFTIILSIKIKGKPIGAYSIDPTFQGIRFLKKEEVKSHLFAGFGNSILTVGYFLLLSIYQGNISVVIPFSQAVILYLVIIESISEKNAPTIVEIQSAVIVTFGAILGSLSIGSNNGSIDLGALAIVFLIINPGWVLFSIYQRKLKNLRFKNRSNDAINIRLWNVIFACISTMIIVLIYDIFSGSNHLINGILSIFNSYVLLSLMAIATFFGFVFYIRALGIGKASVTQAVRSTIIIFSIPVTIVLSYFGFVDPITTDPVWLLIKFIGIILMILGIITFAFTLIKAYIFIQVKPGYDLEELMKNLWKIRGVTRVTAVAGTYDFIIKVRIRTLIKGYERILRKLQEIPSIKNYKWQSVLKEWEDI